MRHPFTIPPVLSQLRTTVLRAMLLLLLGLGTSSAQAQDDFGAGQNLLPNPSFEETKGEQPSFWRQTTWSGNPVFEVENAFGHTGKKCLKVHSESGADASWAFKVKVKPNQQYRLTAWIKTENVAGECNGAFINFHELQQVGKTTPIRGTNDWTKVESTFNSGKHTELMVNCVGGGWGRMTGTAWFDDIKLVALTEPVPDVPEMTQDEAAQFFETNIFPVLEAKCFKCHGGEKVRAEFVMTNRADLIAGGESGMAVDLDSPLESLLLSAVNYEDYEMPPTGKLPEKDIENIKLWLQLGVPWKGEGFKPEVEHGDGPPEVNEETKKWWSFQRPLEITPPTSQSDWAHNDVDRFVLAGLDEVGLKPNPKASRRTLIRRAYYDLTGLPPSPEEVNAFVEDRSADAYEKLIDRLLASKHYGEKWGRHWLDLVRYAESNSYERDGTKPFVWRYRDYVIRSFNNDKPYDQFVIEQLAGDELEDETPESLIATGYYRLGKWDDEPVDRKQAWYDDMDDILKVTSQAFLGLTVDCARCHDHKIDPVPQADYYRMLAFFRNVQRYGVRSHESVLKQSTRPIVSRVLQKQYSEDVQAHRAAVKNNRTALQDIEKRVKPDFIPVEHEEFKHEMNRVPLVKQRVGKKLGEAVFTKEDAERYENLFAEMKRLRRTPPKALESCLCVRERKSPVPDTYVLIRGNAHAESDPVKPGFPSVLSPPEPEIKKPSDGESLGRRLALAKWIVSPENPLAARVMVNRLWQHHFGRGIVRSANDFGFQGTAPTHPELLDWLANDFVKGGWKIKRMHKMLMMSQTYQMSSSSREQALAQDPLNDKFWRFNMRRLTAEEVRDSIFSVNGSINLDHMFGPSIYPIIPPEVLQGQSRPGENWGRTSPAERTRRSVYIHIKRSLPVPLMASFDVADPDSTCPVRFNTVQPTQALGMLNSEFVNQEARQFADYIRRNESDSEQSQIEFALKRVLQREPEQEEVNFGLEFLERMKELGHTKERALNLYCVVALNLNEFLYLD